MPVNSAMMHAVQLQAFGPADGLMLVEAPVPDLDAGDILVRVRASGVNPIEWKIRSGAMARAIGRDLPVTFGWACSGTVEAVGLNVTTHGVGDAVFGYPEFTRGGTHAEFVAMAADQAAAMPAGLDWAAAAAVPMTAQAAWTAQQAAGVKPGERILIHGAAGAVGHWLIQIARNAGAEVIATASGAGIDIVRSLGAARVIDYRTERFETAGGVDVVFDLVGGETQARSWTLLGAGGRLISTAHPIDAARAEARGATGQFIFTPADGSVLGVIGKMITEGRLVSLPVSHILPISQAALAHEMGESGRAVGKMVLLPD